MFFRAKKRFFWLWGSESVLQWFINRGTERWQYKQTIYHKRGRKKICTLFTRKEFTHCTIGTVISFMQRNRTQLLAPSNNFNLWELKNEIVFRILWTFYLSFKYFLLFFFRELISRINIYFYNERTNNHYLIISMIYTIVIANIQWITKLIPKHIL